MADLEYETEAECVAAEAAITKGMNLDPSCVTKRWAIPHLREDGKWTIPNPEDV